MRHGDNDEVKELVDRWVTADQAIELLVQVQDMAEYTIQEHHEEEKEPEIEGYNTEPKRPIPDIKEVFQKKKKLESKGRQAAWDKDEAKAMIRANTPAGEIAKKVGTSVGNIYQLKLAMKKKGELKDEEEEDIEVDNHPKSRVKRMVDAGETDQAIYNVMHDFMTDEQFREAIAEARS